MSFSWNVYFYSSIRTSSAIFSENIQKKNAEQTMLLKMMKSFWTRNLCIFLVCFLCTTILNGIFHWKTMCRDWFWHSNQVHWRLTWRWSFVLGYTVFWFYVHNEPFSNAVLRIYRCFYRCALQCHLDFFEKFL